MGRVVLVLKTWALGFRGNGRTKYAYEMIHLILSRKSGRGVTLLRLSEEDVALNMDEVIVEVEEVEEPSDLDEDDSESG
jgi:hypothetical protein